MSFKNQINKLREDATCNNIACCCLLTEIFQCSILEQTKIISIRLKFKDIISFFSVIHESSNIRPLKWTWTVLDGLGVRLKSDVRSLATVRGAVTISKINQRSEMSDKCRNCGTHGHENFEKFGHGRIFVVSKLLCFEVRKVEMFGLFEYLINPPKVEMPRMVKASPILFHFKFHSRSPCFYLEYISFLG